MLTDWTHLHKYGYVPGGYMGKCHKCETVQFDMDKRATTCLRCATTMHEAEVTKAQEPACDPTLTQCPRCNNDVSKCDGVFAVPQPHVLIPPPTAPCPKCAAAPAGLSWSGNNVYGDAGSIKAVRDAVHYSDQVPEMKDIIKALQAKVVALENTAAGLGDIVNEKAATVAQQAQRIAELEKRLEIDPRHKWDGIACRDATIKAADEIIERQGETIKSLGQAMTRQHNSGDQLAERVEEQAALIEQLRAGTWRPIDTAPEDELVVVGWLDDEDQEHPERYDLDYKEDGGWCRHADNVEYAQMVAPSGSRMPKEQAPYVLWLSIPCLQAAITAHRDASWHHQQSPDTNGCSAETGVLSTTNQDAHRGQS